MSGDAALQASLERFLVVPPDVLLELERGVHAQRRIKLYLALSESSLIFVTFWWLFIAYVDFPTSGVLFRIVNQGYLPRFGVALVVGAISLVGFISLMMKSGKLRRTHAVMLCAWWGVVGVFSGITDFFSLATGVYGFVLISAILLLYFSSEKKYFVD